MSQPPALRPQNVRLDAALIPAPQRVRAPQWLVAWSDPWPPDAPRATGRRGSWWARLGVFVAGMAVVGLIAAVVAVLAGASGTAAAWCFQLFGAVGGYLAMCWLERRWPPYELAPRRLAGLPVGLLLGVVTCSLVVGLLVLFGLRQFTGTNDSFPIAEPLLVMGLTAGVAEEILFRGVMFRLAERALGTWWATAISGLFFGLAHLSNPQATLQGAIAIAVEAGILFALLYALTRNLWLMMGFHAAWNVVQGMLFGSVVSGTSTDQRGWLVSYPTGPDWLSGGGFGIEASPIAVLVLGALAVVCGLALVRTGRVIPGRSHRTELPSR